MEKPNLEYLEQMSDGDKDFIKQIVDIINKELPIEKKSYLDLIEGGNYDEASGLVHKIKHKFIIVGLKEALATADEHERILKENILVFHDDFLESIRIVQDFIQEYNQ